MSELRSRDGVSACAVEFAILTACRSGEVRCAQWAEIDTVRKVWMIPAERMKAKREHQNPLSDAALALLDSMPKDRDTKNIQNYYLALLITPNKFQLVDLMQ